MTREEAAEILLAGEPYHLCPSCGGAGLLINTRIHDEIISESCVMCDGRGNVGNPGHAKAREVLGLEPLRVPTTQLRALQKNILFGVTYGRPRPFNIGECIPTTWDKATLKKVLDNWGKKKNEP